MREDGVEADLAEVSLQDGRELVGLGAEERDEIGVTLVVLGGPYGHRGQQQRKQEQAGSIHGKLPP
jgi:hypothetical protein